MRAKYQASSVSPARLFALASAASPGTWTGRRVDGKGSSHYASPAGHPEFKGISTDDEHDARSLVTRPAHGSPARKPDPYQRHGGPCPDLLIGGPGHAGRRSTMRERGSG